MIAVKRTFSIKEPRTWLPWCVVVALVFRNIIPVGYMPDIARQEYHPFGITICGGTAHQNGAGDKGKGDKTQRNVPCPFSANMATAFSDAETGAIVPVYIFVALIALAAFVFSQARHNGNAAPRAPPPFS